MERERVTLHHIKNPQGILARERDMIRKNVVWDIEKYIWFPLNTLLIRNKVWVIQDTIANNG